MQPATTRPIATGLLQTASVRQICFFHFRIRCNWGGGGGEGRERERGVLRFIFLFVAAFDDAQDGLETAVLPYCVDGQILVRRFFVLLRCDINE